MAGIKRIDIETFRGIRDLHLENLSSINILTGDNNCGKTSILEVLQSWAQPDNFNTWGSLLRRGNMRLRRLSLYEGFYDLFDINLEKKFIHYQIQEDNCTDVLLKATESIEEVSPARKDEILGIKRYSQTIREDENSGYQLYIEGLDDMLEPLSRLELEIQINNNVVNTKNIYEEQLSIPYVIDTEKNSYYHNVVYISPSRHTEGSIYLNSVLNDPELYEEMLGILRDYDEGIISINYDMANELNPGSGRGVFKILSRSCKKALPLNVYGDGMKKALLLMSAVMKAKNGVLLLDEFETAIHTSVMDRTFRWILRTCQKLNVQVFLTSHSREAIDKVLKCDPELQKDISVYTLYKDREQTLVRHLTGEQAVEAQDNMGLELR